MDIEQGLDQWVRNEIERMFGEVDPTLHAVAWFEEDGVRRTFVTYAIRGGTPFDLVVELIKSIRYDHRKLQGEEITDLYGKKNCRLAWRMYPEIDREEDGTYRIVCRLVWWLFPKVDQFMNPSIEKAA